MPLSQEYKYCSISYTKKKLADASDPRTLFKSKVAIS